MNFKMLKILLVITSLLLANSLYAQWTKSLAIYTSYDDNAFRNYKKLSDYTSQISMYLAKDFTGERQKARLFYRGSFNLFVEYHDRNYQFHKMGAAWTKIFNEKGHTFNLGTNAKFRGNRSAYDYYNFKEAQGFANVKWMLGPSQIANLGYRLRGRVYAKLPELDYVEQFVFTRYTQFFKTKTTLMLEINYGRKVYQRAFSENNSSMGEEGHTGRHRGGMGHFGPLSSNTEDENVRFDKAVGQWVGKLRLAQSLTSSTGISFDFLLRRNPHNTIRYLVGQVSGYTSEDELFDDRYGYESQEVSSTLTRLLPWDITMQASTDVLWKDYVNRPTLDLTGEPLSSGELRNDRQLAVGLSVNKTIDMAGSLSLSLHSEFYFMNNHSNDPFYNYTLHFFSFGVSTSF